MTRPPPFGLGSATYMKRAGGCCPDYRTGGRRPFPHLDPERLNDGCARVGQGTGAVPRHGFEPPPLGPLPPGEGRISNSLYSNNFLPLSEGRFTLTHCGSITSSPSGGGLRWGCSAGAASPAMTDPWSALPGAALKTQRFPVHEGHCFRQNSTGRPYARIPEQHPGAALQNPPPLNPRPKGGDDLGSGPAGTGTIWCLACQGQRR